MSANPTGPDFSPPGFVGCYRHPERMTGISCQRCGKPICGECMEPASVGFQCPRCIDRGRASTRPARTRFGAAAGAGGSVVTKVLMGALVVVWLLDFVSGSLATRLLVLDSSAVAGGQVWRLVTASLTSGSFFGVLMNLAVLWLAGRALESELGSWRFAALYLTAGLGGTTLYFVLGPPYGGAYAASAAVVGLLAANAIGKRKAGEDVRGDLGLLLLLVLYAVLVGFNGLGWLTLVGGILVGALTGWVLAHAPRRRRSLLQVAGLAGVVVLCAVAVALRLSLL
ncbi:rhomboid family intramembrane serine protease [Microlunatus capsulatus]|uniref:Membrane associated rhomboid family serine protease n=1 Tax=Microlunatus capsulatus TaxID=99117 RepID=A0ABS4ZBB0_9ACTN|nr:rhomboid family intramembrane serine protease [Microlunatus capsulatus]MBP2418336.1 membrane associated rhomboid family serine protease [Microlunatus capsulatus]